MRGDGRNANKSRVNLLSIRSCPRLALVSHTSRVMLKWQMRCGGGRKAPQRYGKISVFANNCLRKSQQDEKLIALRIIHVILLLYELRLMSIAVGCLSAEDVHALRKCRYINIRLSGLQHALSVVQIRLSVFTPTLNHQNTGCVVYRRLNGCICHGVHHSTDISKMIFDVVIICVVGIVTDGVE